MRVLWEEGALSDLMAIVGYIAQDNAVAAEETAGRITEAVALLRETPGLGRPGRVPNTRELVVAGTSYLVPYRVKRDEIQILRVFHMAQRAPNEW